MVHYGLYECPLGKLVVGWESGCVVSMKLTDSSDHPHHPSPVSDLAAGQILEYFSGLRKSFDLPVLAVGTPFQTAVWQAIGQIPYGETRTYVQIAAMIGNPKAARAVGMACNRNPIWIITPCHRVVGKDGALTGFEGGLDIKKALLELEHLHK